MAIEVKANNGRLTDHQSQFLNDVAGMGGVAFVARSPEGVKVKLEKVGMHPVQKDLFKVSTGQG